MFYLTVLMMTGPKILKNSKNKQINPWPEYNLIALDRMTMNLWTKWVIDLGCEEGQLDEDVGPRLTKYEAY